MGLPHYIMTFSWPSLSINVWFFYFAMGTYPGLLPLSENKCSFLFLELKHFKFNNKKYTKITTSVTSDYYIIKLHVSYVSTSIILAYNCYYFLLWCWSKIKFDLRHV
jgi:hypothetical protein